MKKLKYFIIPIIIMIIIIPLTNLIITKKLNTVLDLKDIDKLKTIYNEPLRDRGLITKREMLKEEDYVLLGSSELSSGVEQNPANFFTEARGDYDLSIYGRAYTQSLQHSALVGSEYNYDGNEKISFIVSMQWFQKENGLEGSDFQVNFSELQFYSFLNNKKISKEDKIYYTTRIAELLTEGGQYVEERIYAELYSRDNIISTAGLTVLKPYYSFKEYLLNMKDKVAIYKYLVKQEDKKDRSKNKGVNWEAEYANAEYQGRQAVTNNDLNVEDTYYDKYIKPNYESIKDVWGNVDLLKSKEVKDYELFLNTCEQLGIKPLIIIAPANGKYYDYLGLSDEERKEFYKAMEDKAREKGFEVFSLADKDYEKYYLEDVMHLGWKGWLEINEKIYNYFD